MQEIEKLAGKPLVEAAIRGEKTHRTPWVPFVGCHAAALIDTPADEYLKSVDKIVEGVKVAIERYQPDGIPLMFDLQLEAEVLGCALNWAKDNPPAVTGHPLVDGVALEELKIPQPTDGRIAISLEATRQVREMAPELALYGLITGPFTLALHLKGTEIFMGMFDAPDEIHRLLKFCSEVAVAMANYYIDAGCDVIGLVDPMTSQIGEEAFREFVSPCVTPVFDAIRERGKLGSFFVCGHAQKNVAAMCDCRPDNISIDENIPLDFARDVCREKGVSFGGNMQLTAVLLLGKPEDAERNALECMTIGQNEGFLLAPGCDLPYATPPENLEAVARLVRDEYRQETVRTMAFDSSVDDVFDMSQYGSTNKVIVDIITLDSEACAPCQYMVEAVKEITPEFDGIVEWREHKIKYRESLVFMASLLVKNVPTICIDGQIRFVSQIPPKEELIAAIQERINEKMRARIHQRGATLYVLAPEKETRDALLQNVQRAITELGSDVEVELVEDEEKIREFGVHPSQTPAIVSARYQVRSTARMPEVNVIKEWIKSMR